MEQPKAIDTHLPPPCLPSVLAFFRNISGGLGKSGGDGGGGDEPHSLVHMSVLSIGKRQSGQCALAGPTRRGYGGPVAAG